MEQVGRNTNSLIIPCQNRNNEKKNDINLNEIGMKHQRNTELLSSQGSKLRTSSTNFKDTMTLCHYQSIWFINYHNSSMVEA